MTAAEEFRDLARQFCALVERAREINPDQFGREVYALLPTIHAAALDLDWRAWSDQAQEDANPDAEEYDVALFSTRRDVLQEVIGAHDRYLHVMHPYDDTELIEASLAVDLAEIDEELRKGMVLADSGNLFAAEASWALTFDINWGGHLVWALQPLHFWWQALEDD